jgi:hypothetical protein
MKDISKPASKETEQVAEAADPFADLASLRLSQDFAAELGVERPLLRVPVRRPNRQDFIRTHFDPQFRLDTAVLEMEADNETFLVHPACRAELFAELVPVRLYTVISRAGTVFLWPVRLPQPDGRSNAWWDSAHEAAAMAQTRWLRIIADRDLGAYQILRAAATLDDPVWPDVSFAELVRLAFRDRLINSPDHPALRKLQGLC